MEEEKKIEHKRKRFSARIKSSKGIICTDVPGQNIILCNVGQATGLEKESIQTLVTSLDIPLPEYIAENGESHSFLVFSRTYDAVIFYKSYNGKRKFNDTPLFMSYVENVPNLETIYPEENPIGLLLLNDFITTEEEQRFISIFDWTEDSSVLKNRQVKHYGFEFRYGSNDVDVNAPLDEKIPEECSVLWKRLREYGIDVGEPDQLTVNKYSPGQGIPSHVDKHSPFGPVILSLSLCAAVVMDWRHHSGRHAPVLVPQRSLLVMTGEARYDWQHGIQPRTHDPIIESRTIDGRPVRVVTAATTPRLTRISLTFRWTRRGHCECSFTTLCDRVGSEIRDDAASRLEELHVHQVYDRIAGHFSSTRHTPWPRVVRFMRQATAGDIVLDLGCGNGKNVIDNRDIMQIAGERSAGLLSECQHHVKALSCARADCVRLDLLHTGLKDRCADVVICIAVIHHFSSKARRLQALSTISRLLRPNGRALITVWAKDQKNSNYICKNKTQTNQSLISVTDSGVTLPVHENRTQFKHSDLLVPWKLRTKNENECDKSETLLRFYHVFEDNELSDLCKELTELVVEDSFYEEGNWCVVCRKI